MAGVSITIKMEAPRGIAGSVVSLRYSRGEIGRMREAVRKLVPVDSSLTVRTLQVRQPRDGVVRITMTTGYADEIEYGRKKHSKNIFGHRIPRRGAWLMSARIRDRMRRWVRENPPKPQVRQARGTPSIGTARTLYDGATEEGVKGELYRVRGIRRAAGQDPNASLVRRGYRRIGGR